MKTPPPLKRRAEALLANVQRLDCDAYRVSHITQALRAAYEEGWDRGHADAEEDAGK